MSRLNLPKPHLSYSQIDLWIKAKETYRKTYYPKVRPHFGQSPEMAFGNEVTLAMERGEKWTDFIPRYQVFEHEFLKPIEGVSIKGAVDNMNPKIIQFMEQKTGRTPWTQAKVDKHKQLDIYSLLLQEEFGRVTDECYLVWVKTEKVKKTIMMGDIELEGESTEIKLTGEYKIFPRIITQKERDTMRALIIQVAREIEEDYAAMKHLYN